MNNFTIEKKFFEAIDRGATSIVKNFLLSGINTDCRNAQLETPLMHAILNENQEIVESILSYNPNLNLQDKEGDPALFYAARIKNFKLVKKLLKMGANINIVNNRRISLLHYAIRWEDETFLHFLLKKGLDIGICTKNKKNVLDFYYSIIHSPSIQFSNCLFKSIIDKYDTLLLSNIDEAQKFYNLFSNYKKLLQLGIFLKQLRFDEAKTYATKTIQMQFFKYYIEDYVQTHCSWKTPLSSLFLDCLHDFSTRSIVSFEKSWSTLGETIETLHKHYHKLAFFVEIIKALKSGEIQHAEMLAKKYHLEKDRNYLQLCTKYQNPKSNEETEKGKSAEWALYVALKQLGFSEEQIFRDLYVPFGNNYAQIDLVLLCSVGIVVFEIKDLSGWIYGNINQKHWTQVLNFGKEKYHFYNPIMQNANHIYCLRKYLRYQIPFFSIVVFHNNCKLKTNFNTSSNTFVIEFSQLKTTLSKILHSNDITQIPTSIPSLLEQAIALGNNSDTRYKHRLKVNNAQKK